MANLKNKSVVMYERPAGLLRLLGANSHVSPAGASSSDDSLKIDGAKIHLDSSSIHDLLTPRLMYLWRGR
jgi:hypothetical protein